MSRRSDALPLLTAITPSIQFPVTICVVCYGENAALAHRFLSTLYRCTNPALFTLRAGLNEVEAATLELFRDYSARFGNIELFVEPQNIFKNPLMRRLFHEKPLTTRWTIWCDDDTHFVGADWLQRLALKIECDASPAIWGKLYQHWSHNEEVFEWIRQARWYRGLPFERAPDANGVEAVRFTFVTGAFWAARTEVLCALDWPDPRLVQANEDFLFCEALRQNGFKLGSFHAGVKVNTANRRNSDAPQVRELQPANLNNCSFI